MGTRRHFAIGRGVVEMGVIAVGMPGVSDWPFCRRMVQDPSWAILDTVLRCSQQCYSYIQSSSACFAEQVHVFSPVEI
jgi:hypothetical protein